MNCGGWKSRRYMGVLAGNIEHGAGGSSAPGGDKGDKPPVHPPVISW